MAKTIDPARKSEALHPLFTEEVPVDDHCSGDRWVVQDEVQLAKLVALIAMGQAGYAAYILKELIPAAPALNNEDLKREAKILLRIQEKRKTPRTGYPRWQRDGFIFESISWIATRQSYGKNVLIKAPHVRSTTQGIDGLLIELSQDKNTITSISICEDKCTDNPRTMFINRVMPSFLEHHSNNRSVELVATASVLLSTAGIDEASAATLSASVMDRSLRRYRASFAINSASDSQTERQNLFEGYDNLDGLLKNQRIGACCIVGSNVREWFESFALKVITYIDSLPVGES